MGCAKGAPGAPLLLCLALAAATAGAAPLRCSYGYQDSTCTVGLARAPAPAPTCPADPGWTTVASAQWIGSQYSAPQCNYQAPPTCPGGFTETSAPVWNGSSWTGLGCQPTIPPPPPTTTLLGQCETALYSWVSGQPWGDMSPGWMDRNSGSTAYTNSGGVSGGINPWSAQTGFGTVVLQDARFTLWTGGTLGSNYEVTGGFDNGGFSEYFIAPYCQITAAGTITNLNGQTISAQCSGCGVGN